MVYEPSLLNAARSKSGSPHKAHRGIRKRWQNRSGGVRLKKKRSGTSRLASACRFIPLRNCPGCVIGLQGPECGYFCHSFDESNATQ